MNIEVVQYENVKKVFFSIWRFKQDLSVFDTQWVKTHEWF